MWCFLGVQPEPYCQLVHFESDPQKNVHGKMQYKQTGILYHTMDFSIQFEFRLKRKTAILHYPDVLRKN